jgi:hypothetical protein
LQKNKERSILSALFYQFIYTKGIIMNKSLKFFAVSLLFVSALRAGDSYSSKAMSFLGWVASHSKQVGIGAFTGAVTTLGFEGAEKVFGASRTGIFVKACNVNEVKLLITQGGNVVVSNQLNSFFNQNSDELDAVTLMERTAGNIIGMKIAQSFFPKAKQS